MTTSTVLEGVIEAANERGIRVQGEWANVSTYRKVEIPEVGTPVRLEVDAKGWIKTLVLSDVAKAGTTSLSDYAAVRLGVLQAAAVFMGQIGQAREQVKADHVLAVADRWLAWVEADD